MNPPGPLRPRRSALWSLTWRGIYRIVRWIDPLIRSWTANDLPGLNGFIELRYPGRRTGRARRTLVTLLSRGGRWYVGHPNGEAGWVRNVEATGWVDVDPPGPHGPRFRAARLPDGPERDAVIRATAHQQPFPANIVYRASQRHIAAVGVYHRLDPLDPSDPRTDDARTPSRKPGTRIGRPPTSEPVAPDPSPQIPPPAAEGAR